VFIIPILKISVPTSKKTQRLSMTQINWLMPFREITAVFSENHTKPIDIHRGQNSVANCQSKWYIHLALGLKGLMPAAA
jgi:hypothetical protein